MDGSQEAELSRHAAAGRARPARDSVRVDRHDRKRHRARPGAASALSYDERSALSVHAAVGGRAVHVAVFPILYSFYISLYGLKLTRPQRVPFVWL